MRLEGNPIHVLGVGGGVPELGGSVETADDLLGALARLADGGVDVVLLSVELPDGRGADVVRAVLERAPEVPVIALADDDEADRAYEAGATDVLPLEGGRELFARSIRYAVSLHRKRTELERLQALLAKADADAPGRPEPA